MPPSGREPSRYRAYGDTCQPQYLVPDLGENAANLPVLAFAKNHFQNRALAVAQFDLDSLSRAMPSARCTPCRSLADTSRPVVRPQPRGMSCSRRCARMCQPICQIAVVCDQNQTVAVHVQPADGEKPGTACGHEIDHSGPAGGIAAGGKHTGRLLTA